MTYITNLAITTSDSIKLQASTLAQLTTATNQLTRAAAVKEIKLVQSVHIKSILLISLDISINQMLSISSSFASNSTKSLI